MDKLNSRKIVKSSLADEVFKQLKVMILDGEWKIGEKIPSEQEIGQMFGVSRLTARIAIERLNTLQICETRVGEGTYVRPFDFLAYISAIDDLMLTDESIVKDVNAFRTAIELCACEQIIQQGDCDKLDELTVYCDRMESMSLSSQIDLDSSTAKKVIAEYVSLDYGFHAQICTLSGNRLLSYSYQMARAHILRYLTLILRKRIKEYVRDHPKEEQVPFELFYDRVLGQKLHRAILNGLKNKDMELIQKIHRNLHNYGNDTAEIH